MPVREQCAGPRKTVSKTRDNTQFAPNQPRKNMVRDAHRIPFVFKTFVKITSIATRFRHIWAAFATFQTNLAVLNSLHIAVAQAKGVGTDRFVQLNQGIRSCAKYPTATTAENLPRDGKK
jgi:hypothetical protein